MAISKKIPEGELHREMRVEDLSDVALVEIVREFGAQHPKSIAAINELIFRNKTLRRELRELIDSQKVETTEG
jgi:hypothetical protein